MLQFTIIGNLGADAKVVTENGKQFVSFNVGHNDRWTDANGVNHESTVWVSCALNGDGGRLLPYLTKGRMVFVQGRGSARVYSSEKARAMVAGLNIMVDRIELVGGQNDAVPRQLYTEDGVLLETAKYYNIDQQVLKNAGYQPGKPFPLRSTDGRTFNVQDGGWIFPTQTGNEQ